MFKKGAFELDATIQPVAIKYNKSFSDPFWNSKRESFLWHLIRLMTSWCLVVDIYFMDAKKREPGEATLPFVNRVKAAIAKQAGIINKPWDGFMKHVRPSPKYVQATQRKFAEGYQQQLAKSKLDGDPPTLEL